ncbi:MAG: hypothetical protein DI536_07045 [Archangium gephyra]|uniref:Uncharacterized protein n=1 Tax=Archangium gephyra TaxID=48 RepID=A0A2W5TXG0_9BACT|nr:MAG: hypothetical protein DI536_07045 [Archangium gephyra]
MSSLLSLVAVLSLGAPESTISFEPLDGGVEVGAAAFSESSVVKGLKNDSGNVARLERQKLLFSFADRTVEEIAADPKAPVIDLVSEGLRNVLLANPKRQRPTVEVQAIDLIALLPRMTKEGERKLRVANMGLWLERARGVDETEADLATIKAAPELAAFKKVRTTFGEYVASVDDSPDEQVKAEKFAKAVDAFAALEPQLRKKVDAWLRTRLKAGELPLPVLTPVPGTLMTRHPFRITDVTPREDGVYFVSWDQPLGYRRSIERVDAEGARSVVASGLDIRQDFQPWRGGWAWVDNRGSVRSLGPDGEKEELSFTRHVVQQFNGDDDVNVLVLEPRREAPKGGPDWVLATWVRDQAPTVLAHGSGQGQILGRRDGRLVLRAGSSLYLFDLKAKVAPVKVPLAEGATYWLDGRVVLNANPLMQTAQFMWVDLKTGVTHKFAEAPMGIVTQDPNLIRLTAGFRPQQVSVLDGSGAPIPLGEWPFVLQVVRAGDEFIVASYDPTLEFGTLSRVARPAK